MINGDLKIENKLAAHSEKTHTDNRTNGPSPSRKKPGQPKPVLKLGDWLRPTLSRVRPLFALRPCRWKTVRMCVKPWSLSVTKHRYPLKVGMDLSVTSPAVIIRWWDQPTAEYHYHFVYFAHSAKQAITRHYRTCTLQGLPEIDKHEYEFPIDRYRAVADTLMSAVRVVLKNQGGGGGGGNVMFAIENYAFDSRETNTLTQLCEVTALIKERIRESGHPFKLYSSSAAKRHWAGYGKGNKEDMWLALRRKHPDLADNIETHFRWSYRERHLRRIAFLAKKAQRNGDQARPNGDATGTTIMNPIQDLVDAFAVLHGHIATE